MSKTGLIAVVGAVSALSVGAGTFLAFRANQTTTPAVEASAATSSAPRIVDHPLPPVRQAPSASAPARAQARAEQPERNPVPAPDSTLRESAPKSIPAAPTSEPVTPPIAVAPPPPPTPVETPVVATAAATVDPQPVQEAAKPRFEEITVKDAVIGIKLDQTVSSETARVEDRVTAKVTRDVTVDGKTAIASGTRLEGVVTTVVKGGKFRERARVGVKFNTLILADGLRVPIQTEAILREGESPSNEAGSKIGASAVAGAIIGGLIGGKRGAVIGSTAGAAGGTAAVAAGGRNEAVIQSGSPLTVLLTAPVTITIEREPAVR